jgi:adenylate cyclase
MRFLPNIRYGTERYPERVARRLRAVNMTAWIAAAVAALAAVAQALSPVPGMWKLAAVSAASAMLCAAIPRLHRYGPLAAALGLVATLYVSILALTLLFGTASGLHRYYLLFPAGVILFFGTERTALAAILSAAAAALAVALEIYAPHDTGLVPAQRMLIGNLVVSVVAGSAILFAVVHYAVRQTARAEAALESEYARSEGLLLNILPPSVAARLKGRGPAQVADRYGEASVLFADMAGFTARASDTAPEDLAAFLNGVFTRLDTLVERHGLEKIKTTGDSYMVVSGVPVPRADHAEALAALALDMREALAGLVDPKGRPVPVRIGIASGPVVAGVVGTRKFFYDVWGDTVNTAARMEQTGEAGRIQLSPETRARLVGRFVLEERGTIEVRGKGPMRTWFLEARKSVAAAPRTE